MGIPPDLVQRSAAARAAAQILIVEDDDGSRRALTNVLEDRGYRVAAVGSAPRWVTTFATSATTCTRHSSAR